MFEVINKIRKDKLYNPNKDLLERIKKLDWEDQIINIQECLFYNEDN